MTAPVVLAWPGAPAPLAGQNTKPRAADPWTFEKATILGGSPQALGLAVALARNGVDVLLIEEDRYDATRAKDALIKGEAHSGIRIVTDVTMAQGAELIVEASGAGTQQRTELLGQIATSDAKLVASMGAGADGTYLAQGLPDASAFLMLDTDSPPPAMDLIEIVATPCTTQEATVLAQGLAARLGAIAVNSPRFIGAQLIARLEDAVEHLIFHGSTPWDVDDALEAMGFQMGACRAWDRRGLDIAYARHRAEEANGTRRDPNPVLDRMVPEGRLGRKGGVGWYRYPGGGGDVIDPLIEDLAREEAFFAGVTTRDFQSDDIRRHVILALIDEAAILLSQLGDADAIDLVSCYALGFPMAQHGILSFARRLGFAKALVQLEGLAREHAQCFQPSAALRDLAKSA